MCDGRLRIRTINLNLREENQMSTLNEGVYGAKVQSRSVLTPVISCAGSSSPAYQG